MAKTRIELFVHLCLTTSDRPQMQTRHIMRQNALLLSPSGPIPYGILRQQSWRKNDINCVNQQHGCSLCLRYGIENPHERSPENVR